MPCRGSHPIARWRSWRAPTSGWRSGSGVAVVVGAQPPVFASAVVGGAAGGFDTTGAQGLFTLLIDAVSAASRVGCLIQIHVVPMRRRAIAGGQPQRPAPSSATDCAPRLSHSGARTVRRGCRTVRPPPSRKGHGLCAEAVAQSGPPASRGSTDWAPRLSHSRPHHVAVGSTDCGPRLSSRSRRKLR